jgi:hypothetical protein
MKKEIIGGESPTNGAKEFIEMTIPYIVKVKIEGCSDYLYHRWNNESVAEKSAAKKGSKIKKTDDVESFVYRNHDGILCIPGEQIRMSIIYAAKYRQDPRSSRKSAMDLFKAGIVVLTDLSSVGCKDWDYMDMRRVVIQRASVTRSRPALKKGWKAEFEIMVNIPEYISQCDLNETIAMAGRLNGIGDFRPTFGRFNVVGFEVI